MANMWWILIVLGVFCAGVAGGYFWRLKFVEKQNIKVENDVKNILSKAHTDASEIKKKALVQAKDSILKMKIESEKEFKEKVHESNLFEKRLRNKEENFDRKIDSLEKKEKSLVNKENMLANQKKELDQKVDKYNILLDKQKRLLESISGMSIEEAKNMLIRAMEDEAHHDAAKLIRNIISEAKDKADKDAKDIVSLAIQRYAGDYVAEKTVSVVNLPTDEMKGRIIGREGRNIRAIEAATGIDLIIDDTPEAVILSGFNPIRREVARLSLEKLISDGRIHPARIEDVVNDVSKELDIVIRETGEQAAFDIGVHGIHPELIMLIGKLKYRSSYSQNVLQHSIEVAFLTGIMAAELGINIKQAKRAGLLHDIGKAVDHEIEGPHATIGSDIAKKYGESYKIIHAIGAHHEDIQPETILAVLVQAADALSGARPGARKELLESYVKRLQDLEKVALSFDGVDKSYAIQAGRELRIMVKSDKIKDSETVALCRDIAKKIEAEMSYPGQIKVTLIRETRQIAYAK